MAVAVEAVLPAPDHRADADITLRDTVHSGSEREPAIYCAGDAPGVRSVVDQPSIVG